MLQGMMTTGSYRSAGTGNIFTKAKKTTTNGYTMYSIAGIGYGRSNFTNPISFTFPKITLPNFSVNQQKTSRVAKAKRQ